MSRGGLLLRAARAGEELAYTSALGAVRRGQRPPRLAAIPGILREAEDAAGEGERDAVPARLP